MSSIIKLHAFFSLVPCGIWSYEGKEPFTILIDADCVKTKVVLILFTYVCCVD